MDFVFTFTYNILKTAT